MSCGGFVVATETICQTKPNICAHGPLPGVCQRPHPHRDPHTHLPRSSLLSRWSCGLRYIQGFEIPSGILSKRIPNFQGEGGEQLGGCRDNSEKGDKKRKKWSQWGKAPSVTLLPLTETSRHYDCCSSCPPKSPDAYTVVDRSHLVQLVRGRWVHLVPAPGTVTWVVWYQLWEEYFYHKSQQGLQIRAIASQTTYTTTPPGWWLNISQHTMAHTYWSTNA